MTHGLTARDLVLPNENPDVFDRFRADLLITLDPQGGLEGMLAEKIIADGWRFRRVVTFETALYQHGCKELLVKQAEESVRRYESTERDRVLASLEKKKVAACDRQAHQVAEQRLEGERARLNDPSFNVVRVLETSPEPFLNLWRHEAQLSRSLLRNMHELERLQARRAGEHVPTPEIVDVDVSVSEPAAVDVIMTGPNGETNGNPR